MTGSLIGSGASMGVAGGGWGDSSLERRAFGKEWTVRVRGERDSCFSFDALLPIWMFDFHQVHTAESINGSNNHD